jgi:DNA-binding NtrC family response regulator
MTDNTRHALLLVDDEPDILYSLQSLLRRQFEVHTAEGGEAALAMLSEHCAHVIMTDQRMPGMSGVEFLARAQQICPDAIPIVFTGYADLKAVVEAVNRGHIFRYVTKPWDPDDLAKMLTDAAAHYDRVTQRKRLLKDLKAYIERGLDLASSARGPAAQPSPEQAAWQTWIARGNELLERFADG